MKENTLTKEQKDKMAAFLEATNLLKAVGLQVDSSLSINQQGTLNINISANDYVPDPILNNCEHLPPAPPLNFNCSSHKI